MKKQLGPDAWRRLVLDLEEGRKTQKEFAAANDVSVSTLQFWVYILRKEARRACAPPALLPVEVVNSAAPLARQGTTPSKRWRQEPARPSAGEYEKGMARELPLGHPCPWREVAEEQRERMTALEQHTGGHLRGEWH